MEKFLKNEVLAKYPNLAMGVLAMLEYIEWIARTKPVEFLTRLFGKQPQEEYWGYRVGPYEIHHSTFDKMRWAKRGIND